MRIHTKATLILILVLALALTGVGSAAAQDGDPPPEYDHPIVALLGLYFEPYFGPDVGEEIATYHEEGLGFGVLVKLYAMAAVSQEACVDEEPCESVTVEELVAAFQSGTGLGQLFKDYGRPSILGVGHAKGRPDHAGPPDHAGRPDHAGPPEHAGKPDHAGRPDHAGPPDRAGPKDRPKKK